jgi:hypothetical protein
MAVGLSYRWLGGTGFDYIESSLVFSNLVDYPQDPINLDGFLADVFNIPVKRERCYCLQGMIGF